MSCVASNEGATATVSVREATAMEAQAEVLLPSQIPHDPTEDTQASRRISSRKTSIDTWAKTCDEDKCTSFLRVASNKEARKSVETPMLVDLEALQQISQKGEIRFKDDADEEHQQQQQGDGPRSVVSISDLFAFWAQELHINQSEATAKASLLGESELLWTTEDLYMLGDHATFMLLPIPLHMKRWLYQEKDRLLYDPAKYMSAGGADDINLHTPTSATTERALQETARRRRSITIHSIHSFPPVEVTCQINSVSRLNVLEICYDIDFTLMLDWTDPSVIGMCPDEIQSGDIFNPHVIVDNVIGNDQPIAGSSTRPRVHRLQKGKCMDGHLKKTSRYRVTLTCPDLDLWAFPFDTQCLPIRLKARNHPIQEKAANHVDLPLVLFGPEGAAGQCAADGLRKSGHSLDARADLLSEFWIHSLMGLRSDPPDRWYELNIIIFRDPRHVLWNVAFPTLMMLLFAFSVYSIPIEEIGARMENTSTCLLAMMAFQGTIKEMLPPMPYITAMGRYVIVTYVILTCHGFEHAIFFMLTSKPEEDDTTWTWRNRPSDYFFGILNFWSADSIVPVQLERAVVLTELAALLIFHVTFVCYIRRLREKGTQRRTAEAIGHPGISLIEGCPQWGHSSRSSFHFEAASTKSAGVTRSSKSRLLAQ